MQPNFGNVYRIPESQPKLEPEKQPDAEELSSYSLLDSINRSQGVNELRHLETKRWVSPVCGRLKKMGKNFRLARSLEIDSKFFFHNYDNNETGFVKSAFKRFLSVSPAKQLMPMTMEKLINEESKIGGEIFGEQPNGEHVSFFYYGEDEAGRERWYFKRERVALKKDPDYAVLSFEIQDNSILKIITKNDGSKIAYEYLKGKELTDFVHATEIYHNRVMKNLYGHEGCLDDECSNVTPINNTTRLTEIDDPYEDDYLDRLAA